MSVRINFEIGHEAAIRTKRTQEGFTHDWEVFVRGCDGANIHYYVEKVVFYLHETFPKPKRVIKEPPYSVKESGYAGFTLPVEIHLRNKDEPKKISLTYDLHLQPSGAPLSEVQSKKYVFNMPGEDFKLKLLKGGGVIVNSSNSHEVTQENRTLDDKSQLISKPRLGGSDIIKKHKSKIEDPRSSFQALFGAPITKTSKASVESKPISKDKNSNVNKTAPGDKDKVKKHSPHKEKDKDKLRDKEDKVKRDDKKRDEKKDRSKEREDRVKEKRKDKSPKMRSPTPTKRISSPKRVSSPSLKHKDDKKMEVPKDKKLPDEREKFEKKVKKEKRDKDRKDNIKYKDREQKSMDQKENKNLTKEKEKHKEDSVLTTPRNGKEKIMKEKEVLKDYIKETKDSTEAIEKNGKLKTDKIEEKVKHKHKRKDKDKKEKDKFCERTPKSEKKLEKFASKYVENKDAQKEIEKIDLFNSPKQMTSTDKFVETDSSNSSISSQEDLFSEPAPVLKTELKKDPLFESEPDKKLKKDKSKRNKDKKSEKNLDKKRKRKSDSAPSSDGPLEKVAKEESSNIKESDETNFSQEKQADGEENYEDYMNILRDLQHKILTLQDNTELQRVVQLIAETGRFEVSAQTFDFDLCLLERSTITQLQNFFEGPS
ncbi:hypothetical protein FQR65_LT08910 [Abscondita terminalis]|nr:hypothetical protein FQR65_LT08910 [Abscondita terminalis]